MTDFLFRMTASAALVFIQFAIVPHFIVRIAEASFTSSTIKHKSVAARGSSTFGLRSGVGACFGSSCSGRSSSSLVNYNSRRSTKAFRDTRLWISMPSKPLFEQLKENLIPKNSLDDVITPTESDLMIDFIDHKPWRAPKVKNLPVHYRPAKDSWMEKYRNESDETIYLYTLSPQDNIFEPQTKHTELWSIPYLWTKIKSERLAWIKKHFMVECETVSAQEHIELDCLYSEFDMPTRWSYLRLKEMDVLNVICFWLCYYTAFTWVKPSDLGLRPDGSLKPCPVQFHTCISSSNHPTDDRHYAPPLKWSRSKSPDQAYEEIKFVYYNYPKKGLSWTHGWIDRGGWKPQEFSGPYFHAQANSLVWNWAEDIEFKLDPEKRQVQYRSSARLGQVDWDVERFRYNQFVRMLKKKGGWEVEEIPRAYWVTLFPYRWTELALDKAQIGTEKLLNNMASAYYSVSDVDGGSGGGSGDVQQSAARRAWAELVGQVLPYIEPVINKIDHSKEQLLLDPRVASTLHSVEEIRQKIEKGANEALHLPELQRFAEKILKELPASDTSSVPLQLLSVPKSDLANPTDSTSNSGSNSGSNSASKSSSGDSTMKSSSTTQAVTETISSSSVNSAMSATEGGAFDINQQSTISAESQSDYGGVDVGDNVDDVTAAAKALSSSSSSSMTTDAADGSIQKIQKPPIQRSNLFKTQQRRPQQATRRENLPVMELERLKLEEQQRINDQNYQQSLDADYWRQKYGKPSSLLDKSSGGAAGSLSSSSKSSKGDSASWPSLIDSLLPDSSASSSYSSQSTFASMKAAAASSSASTQAAPGIAFTKPSIANIHKPVL